MIKKHPFFDGLDWDLLEQKKLKPLIKPKVKNQGDTKNIEDVFLFETLKNTPSSYLHP
jgi:hypothetical protein